MAKLICLDRFGNGVCGYMHGCDYDNICLCAAVTTQENGESNLGAQSIAKMPTQNVCAEANCCKLKPCRGEISKPTSVYGYSTVITNLNGWAEDQFATAISIRFV